MQIYGNEIDSATCRKAIHSQKKFVRRFGDDRKSVYHLSLADNDVLTPPFGCKIIKTTENPLPDSNLPPKPIIIGNIRMGFGHYRISLARS